MLVDTNNVLRETSVVDLKDNTLIIPYGVVEIAEGAIKDLPKLSNLIIPETVKIFRSRSVTNTGIVHLIIPENIVKINDCAFEGNPWLTILEICNPDTEFNGSIVQNCLSINSVRVGAMRFNVRCLKFGVAYEIISKKMIDIYTVYAIKPFKEAAKLGMLYAAVKQGVVGDGVSIKRAIEDCNNLYLTPNIKEAYKDITLDTLINSHDYKRITGACDEGIMEWLEKEGLTEADTMTARDLIYRLGKSFGAKDFAQFIADRYKDRAEARKNGD